MAGVIGLAPGSSVWDVVDLNNTGLYSYRTRFSNNANWNLNGLPSIPKRFANTLSL